MLKIEPAFPNPQTISIKACIPPQIRGTGAATTVGRNRRGATAKEHEMHVNFGDGHADPHLLECSDDTRYLRWYHSTSRKEGNVAAER